MRERSSKTGGRTGTGGKRYLRTLKKKTIGSKLVAHRSTAPTLENHHRLQVRTDSCHVLYTVGAVSMEKGMARQRLLVVAVAARATVSLTLPDPLTVDSFSQCGSDLTGLLSYSCLCEFVKGAYLHAPKKKKKQDNVYMLVCALHIQVISPGAKKKQQQKKNKTAKHKT